MLDAQRLLWQSGVQNRLKEERLLQAGEPQATHPAEHAVLNHVYIARSSHKSSAPESQLPRVCDRVVCMLSDTLCHAAVMPNNRGLLRGQEPLVMGATIRYRGKHVVSWCWRTCVFLRHW